MDIDEAAAILEGPRSPRWEEAVGAVGRFVEREARKSRATSSEAEDIGQELLIKVLPRLQAGEVPWDPGSHRAFLRKCARNGVASRRRQDRRQVPAPVDDLPTDTADAPDVSAERELLQRLAETARQCRAPRYRVDFDLVWKQLQALAFDEKPLRALLEEEGVLAPQADHATYVRARNNAHKAHERARSGLLAAVQALVAAGQLTSAEADRARRALRVFVRCHRRDPPRVSTTKGPV